MNREIDASICERFLNFFREHPFGADHGEGDVGNLVAGGVNNFDFHFVSARAKKCGDVVGLPQGQLRAAGADPEFTHQWQPPTDTTPDKVVAAIQNKVALTNPPPQTTEPSWIPTTEAPA